MANIASKVFDIIKPYVEKHGVKLWDVRYVKEGASYYLRVYIYKPEGIGIDDCTAVSHEIDPVIDEADPISGSYYLEVCSTGINAELTREEHYRLLKGKKAVIKLYKEFEGAKELTGAITGYENGPVITLDNGKTVVLNKEEISKAYLSDNE